MCGHYKRIAQHRINCCMEQEIIVRSFSFPMATHYTLKPLKDTHGYVLHVRYPRMKHSTLCANFLLQHDQSVKTATMKMPNNILHLAVQQATLMHCNVLFY